MSVKASSVNLRSVVIGIAGAGLPTIASFSPTSGTTSTSVTITGTNLSGTTDVQFNGTSSTSLSGITSTSVTATVPTGATTGIITVITPAGSANTSTLSPSEFTVAGAITISELDFTTYSGSPFIVQQLPFGAPNYTSVPYTWNPSTDEQFVLNPGENVTVQLTMSGYTGAVTGTSYTTGDGVFQITAVGQTGNTYQFSVTNIESTANGNVDTLTFTVTDSVSSTGSYGVTAIDVFT